MWEYPLLRSSDEYRRILESLREMDRHERDESGIYFLLILLISILIGNEGDILEEARYILRIDESIIARRHIEELIEIFHLTVEFFFCVFGLKICFISRSFDDIIHELCDRCGLRELAESSIEECETLDSFCTYSRDRIQEELILCHLGDRDMFPIEYLEEVFE